MKNFRKLKVTITFIESSSNVVAEMRIKGSSKFTYEETNKIINEAKREYFKTAIEEQTKGIILKTVK